MKENSETLALERIRTRASMKIWVSETNTRCLQVAIRVTNAGHFRSLYHSAQDINSGERC